MKWPFNIINIFFNNFFGNNFLWQLMNGALGKVIKNPMSLFVYGILSKWYIAVLIACTVVTFWVFKGLNDAGILKAAEEIVFTALNESKSVAKNCIPQISKPADFWKCLQNPPEYAPSEDEKKLQHSLEKVFKQSIPTNNSRNNGYNPAGIGNDPYEDELEFTPQQSNDNAAPAGNNNPAGEQNELLNR